MSKPRRRVWHVKISGEGEWTSTVEAPNAGEAYRKGVADFKRSHARGNGPAVGTLDNNGDPRFITMVEFRDEIDA